MLARLVFAVWGAWLGTLGLAAALTASQIWSPNPILFLGLLALMLAAPLSLVGVATVRLVRGPRRHGALAALLLGTAPLWFVVGHILMAIRPAFDRQIAPEWSSRVLLTPGRSLAELQARWSYPERTAGRWVTMVGARTETARAQVTAMDRHVDALLARLGRPETWPMVWYRGPLLLGLGPCAIYDMALGTEVGRWPTGGRRAGGPGPPRGRPLRHHPELHRPERPAEGLDGGVGAGQPGDDRGGAGRDLLGRPREGTELDPQATRRPGLVLVFGAGGLQPGSPARQLPPPGPRPREILEALHDLPAGHVRGRLPGDPRSRPRRAGHRRLGGDRADRPACRISRPGLAQGPQARPQRRSRRLGRVPDRLFRGGGGACSPPTITSGSRPDFGSRPGPGLAATIRANTRST